MVSLKDPETTSLTTLTGVGPPGHLGIAVPDTVRLIGFDDLPIAAQTNPPLTTIRQDIGAGARALVDLLMRRLAGEDTESLVMPPKLVARGTA